MRDNRREPLYHPLGAQTVDATLHRRRAQRHAIGDLPQRTAAVLRQQRNYLAIDGVQALDSCAYAQDLTLDTTS